MRIPLTPSERTGLMRSAQVQTYSLDDLKLLWQHGTPFQRLLLLLALNGGFGRAEIASLDLTDVHLRHKHPYARELGCSTTSEDSWIFRMRHKTGVYGEFELWKTTVEGIEWWLRQRERITVGSGVSTLLINQQGRRYDKPTKGSHANYQIPNARSRLTEKIRAAHPSFRRLSFNRLRKTAGNLIRAASHGEIAAVFLCHGRPVKSDELLDLYTNRPFAKVFQSLERVEDQLEPIWAEVAEPFPEGCRETILTLTPSTIRRVQTMKRQGHTIAFIAESLCLWQEATRHAAKQAES